MRTIVLIFISAVLAVLAERADAQAWQSVDPASAGWSAEKLADAKNFAAATGATAVMVVQNGKVVASWGDVSHNIFVHSVRKSFLSALYGIAVADGRINLGSTLAELGIDDKDPALTPAEKQATVRDLLMARSGVYHLAAQETEDMRSKRPERGTHAHGSFWFYNNWDFNALGTIYKQQTGDDIFQSFATRIAAPIGMEDFSPSNCHYSTEFSSIHPAYLFSISARDAARFGQLYLNRGQWYGKQIVPAAWVSASTTAYSRTGRPNMGGYGYLWWTLDGFGPGAATASGTGGQKIAVAPSKHLVVVQLVASANTSASHSFPDLLRRLVAAAP